MASRKTVCSAIRTRPFEVHVLLFWFRSSFMSQNMESRTCSSRSATTCFYWLRIVQEAFGESCFGLGTYGWCTPELFLQFGFIGSRSGALPTAAIKTFITRMNLYQDGSRTVYGASILDFGLCKKPFENLASAATLQLADSIKARN